VREIFNGGSNDLTIPMDPLGWDLDKVTALAKKLSEFSLVK